MKRLYKLAAILILLPQLIIAQNFADGFRLSYNQIQGTARAAAMGNAFGALGGDFTSLSINPAGSALYLSGEFVITPNYFSNGTTLKAGNTNYTDNEQSFSINNIGAVGKFSANPTNSGVVSVNYGIGFNRLANFNGNSLANFNQSGVSWLDDIAGYANNQALTNSYLKNKNLSDVYFRDWTTKLAWDTYLIDPDVDENNNVIDQKYHSILYENEKVDQQKTISQSGKIDEYVLNLSINFNHKFYLGTTVGIQDINYKRISTYGEAFNKNSFNFYDDYYMNGTGVNVKIGAIYKPVQSVRLGLAFHSPTFYRIDDRAELKMNSFLAANHSKSGESLYNYSFNTPMKLVASGALVFAKKGLLSLDAEYQNYASMRFRNGGNGGDNFNDLNSVMGNVFKSVINLRVGAEYKVTKQFALRGGYEMYGNPFEKVLDEQTTLTGNTSVIGLGFGYTINSVSLNAAYTNTLLKTSEGNAQPNYYQLPGENLNHNIMFTLGLRF
ncbi:MAG: hypothetical protein CSA36_02030 [Draconibacterium sp.]|nr:MAG: hypothetical protein CSA36_02030 [Draconibacterium sp.]